MILSPFAEKENSLFPPAAGCPKKCARPPGGRDLRRIFPPRDVRNSSAGEKASLPSHQTAHDQLLDLGRPLVNAEHLGVAHPLLHREVPHVAISPEDLHR